MIRIKITVENIQKLEKLSITYIWRTKGIWHLVQKCRKLLELIFAHFAAEANMYITPTVINEILAQNIACDEFMSQVHKKYNMQSLEHF